MSIKIYDGLRLKDPDKLWEFREWMSRKYSEVRLEKLIHSASELAIRLFDLQETTPNSPLILKLKNYFKNDESIIEGFIPLAKCLRFALGYTYESSFEERKKRDNKDGMGIFKNPVRNEIYLYPYYNIRELTLIVDDSDYVEEFGYWDNTDPPEETSDKAWADRLVAWMQAIDMNQSLGSQGFQMVLEDDFEHNYIDVKRYIEYGQQNGYEALGIPSEEQRKNNLTNEILISEFLKKPGNEKEGFKALAHARDNKDRSDVVEKVNSFVVPFTEQEFMDTTFVELVEISNKLF